MNYKYAGIGARATPGWTLHSMGVIANQLEEHGWILRSGGAKGADRAFEQAVINPNRKQIFTVDSWPDADWESAYNTVNMFHPAPNRLSDYPRALMARNAFQVLGPHLDDPVEMVICWTPDGAEERTTRETGGTGQAIRIANAKGIPVVNLANPEAFDRISNIVNQVEAA